MVLNYLFQLLIELNYTKKQGSNHCTKSVVWMDYPTKPIIFIASYIVMMKKRFGWKKVLCNSYRQGNGANTILR